MNQCNLDPASAAALRGAPWLPRLVRLSLSGNAILDRGVETLLAGGSLPHLHELLLASCRLTPTTAQALAGARLTELHWLDLSSNALGPEGAKILASAALTESLLDLNLDGNKLGDEGAIALAAGTWPLLIRLSLRSNSFKEPGGRALAGSQTMPRLNEVQCRDNGWQWNILRELGPRFRQW